jgi:hypothetical protein
VTEGEASVAVGVLELDNKLAGPFDDIDVMLAQAPRALRHAHSHPHTHTRARTHTHTPHSRTPTRTRPTHAHTRTHARTHTQALLNSFAQRRAHPCRGASLVQAYGAFASAAIHRNRVHVATMEVALASRAGQRSPPGFPAICACRGCAILAAPCARGGTVPGRTAASASPQRMGSPLPHLRRDRRGGGLAGAQQAQAAAEELRGDRQPPQQRRASLCLPSPSAQRC